MIGPQKGMVGTHSLTADADQLDDGLSGENRGEGFPGGEDAAPETASREQETDG